MDRLAHFDIAVHYIVGSNLKFTDFLSRNFVGGAAIEDKYDEEDVIITTEHAEFNAKYGSLFDSQSNLRTEETEKERKRNRNEIEQKKNQSQTNRIFQNKNHVIKLNADQNTVETRSTGRAKYGGYRRNVIMRGDNLPILDLSKYHTDGKSPLHTNKSQWKNLRKTRS